MLSSEDPKLIKPRLYKTALVPSILLIVLVAVLLTSLNRLRSNYNLVIHTNEIVAKANRLERMIIDSETGIRGFRITQDPDFLEPYNNAVKEVPPLFNKLNFLINDNKDQLALSSEIEEKYKALIASWSETKNIPVNQIKYQRSLELKRQMDNIRNDFSRFISNEERRLKKREIEVKNTVNITIILMVLLGGLSILFLIFNTNRVFAETLKALEKFQKSLERRTAELEATLNNAPIGFASYNRNYQYVSINPVLASINGQSVEYHLNKTIKDILPDASVPEAMIEKVFQTGEASTRDFSGETLKDPGAFRYWTAGFYPIRIHGKVELVGLYLFEITDKKLVEEKLVKALKMRDEFLTIASHELKTPITSLLLQTQMIERNIRKGKWPQHEQIEKYINLSIRQCHQLSRLIEDMLDISRIRTDKLSIRRERVDLCKIVNQAITKMSSQFDALKIPVPSITGEASVVGNWDAIRIEQVINNLLSNTLKYGRGKPIQVKVYSKGHKAIVQVIDQGVGIPADRREAIFERFERAINLSEVSGLGLGLFIAKQIVLAHGGRTWVESNIEKGSTFYVELPIDSDVSSVLFRPRENI